MVVCPLADSYIHTVAQDAGAVAELAAARKIAKYTALENNTCGTSWKGVTEINICLA